MVRSIVFISLLCASHFAASRELDGDSFGQHHGYITDIKAERNKRDIEMVMLGAPPAPPPPIKDVIFNEKLSRDFQSQYEYRFGSSTAEQVLNTAWRSDEYTYSTGQNTLILNQQKKEQDFGEYMARKLIEFHVDDWAKNDPDFRPVYKVKDRISNLNVQVKKGYKVKWKYNFAGPNMEVKVDNPYDVDTKVRMEMTGIISTPAEIIYSLGYPVTNKVSLSALYRQIDGLYQLGASRRLSQSMSASITASTDTSSAGSSVQQNTILLGLRWND